jgi:hypothetical protein
LGRSLLLTIDWALQGTPRKLLGNTYCILELGTPRKLLGDPWQLFMCSWGIPWELLGNTFYMKNETERGRERERERERANRGEFQH